MIINIRVTEAAISYLEISAGLDREFAEEVSQEFISLCNISGSETPKYQEEKKLLRGIRELVEKYKDDETFASRVFIHADRLDGALGQFIDILEREKGSESRLQRAARQFLEFKAAILSKEFDPDSMLMKKIFQDLEEAVFNLPEGSDPPLISRDDLDNMLWDSHVALVKAGANPGYQNTEEAIKQIVERAIARYIAEGEGSESRLQRAARALIDYDMPYDSGYELLIKELEEALEEGGRESPSVGA